MAIAAVAARGTGTSSTSSTTLTMSPSATVAVDRILLLTVVTDNTTTTDGATSDHTTVGDTESNSWTKLGEYTNGEGAAASGVTVSLWRTRVTSQLTTGTTITITLGTARTDKCCSLYEFSVADGATLNLDQAGTGNATDASNGYGSVSISGLESASRLYFRALGKEANSTANITPSTNFTAISAARSRNNANAVLVRGEFRINTSTGETSNPTLAVSGDTAGMFFALHEYTPFVLTSDQGTYSLSGQDATLTYFSPAKTGASAPLPSLSLLFTGVNTTLAADQGTYALSGQSASVVASYRVTAEQGTYSLSGQDAGLSLDAGGQGGDPAPLPSLGLTLYFADILQPDQGTYTLSGQDAALQWGRIMPAEQGTYTLSGQDAELARLGQFITAESGTYSLTGRDAFLSTSGPRGWEAAPLPSLSSLFVAGGYTLECDAGIYSVIGSESLADFAVTAESGTYTLAGQDANFRRGYVVAAEQGTYSVSGQDADLIYGSADKDVIADQGSYALTGQDAVLRFSRRLVAEQGFYSLGGQAAQFSAGRGFVAERGTYTLSGQVAILQYEALASINCETGYYTLDGQEAFRPADTDTGGAYKKIFFKVGDRTVYGTRRSINRLLMKLAEDQAREDAKEAEPEAKPVPVLQDAPVELVAQMSQDPVLTKRVEKTYEVAYLRAYEAAMAALAEQRRKEEEQEEEEALLLML